jgi:hypothetical protein
MAWTITEHTPVVTKMKIYSWDTLIKVRLQCTSDASSSDYDLVATMIKGSYLYLVKIVPGTGADEPDAAFDLDIEDELDVHLLDTDDNAAAPTGGATYHGGHETMGVYPPIEKESTTKVSVVCATLGNGKKADIYLYFTK